MDGYLEAEQLYLWTTYKSWDDPLSSAPLALIGSESHHSANWWSVKPLHKMGPYQLEPHLTIYKAIYRDYSLMPSIQQPVGAPISHEAAPSCKYVSGRLNGVQSAGQPWRQGWLGGLSQDLQVVIVTMVIVVVP